MITWTIEIMTADGMVHPLTLTTTKAVYDELPDPMGPVLIYGSPIEVNPPLMVTSPELESVIPTG